MISDAEYAKLKRQFRLTQDWELLADVIHDVVERATRPGRIPAALAEGGAWNADSRADAAQAWITERLLPRRDVMSAFDFASRPGPFYGSLERSFRHFLLNAERSTETQNLVSRASALMRSADEFDEWRFGGRSWWGLAEWRQTEGTQPSTWNGSDEQLVGRAWACGEFVITRYGSKVGRASPILERPELARFLAAFFTRTETLLEAAHLRTVFERRFAAGTTVANAPLEDDLAVAADESTAALEEAEVKACAVAVLEEITPRQAEVVRRKYLGETLEQIASALGVARGTVDNELGRVGLTAKQLAGDADAEYVLEKLFDMLSINAQ